MVLHNGGDNGACKYRGDHDASADGFQHVAACGKANAREFFARGVDTVAAFANERRSYIAKEHILERSLSARVASSCPGNVAASCVYVFVYLCVCVFVA